MAVGVVVVIAAAAYLALTRSHNVVRYFWLNWAQDPGDWIPMFGQMLPNPIRVDWCRKQGLSRLVMLQSYTKNIAAYASLSARINKRYCDAHGYLFEAIVSDEPCNASRNPCWDKVFYISKQMEKMKDGEWIFWLDSDAVVDQPKLSFESIAAAMPACADIGICTSIPFTKNINTGAMLIRVTPYTRKFLKNWWNWPNLRWRQGMCHEQSALDEIMAKDAYQCCSTHKIVLFGPTEFNSTYQHGLSMRGKFIQHYRGCSLDKRIAAFSALI